MAPEPDTELEPTYTGPARDPEVLGPRGLVRRIEKDLREIKVGRVDGSRLGFGRWLGYLLDVRWALAGTDAAGGLSPRTNLGVGMETAAVLKPITATGLRTSREESGWRHP